MNKQIRKAIQKMVVAKTRQAMIEAARPAGLVEGNRVRLDGIGLTQRLSGTDISAIDFRNIQFRDIRWVNCVANGTTFVKCTFDQVWFAAEGAAKSNFSGLKFQDCSFKQATFGPATMDLSSSSFIHCRFDDCVFRMGRLRYAVFDRSYLNYVMLRSADLKEASFRSAVLKKVSFEKAVLDGTDFEGASFVNMNFWGPIDFSNCINMGDLQQINSADAKNARG